MTTKAVDAEELNWRTSYLQDNYSKECEKLRRLIRRYQPFSADRFDKCFRRRSSLFYEDVHKRSERYYLRPAKGMLFNPGGMMGITDPQQAWLGLLQMMMSLGTYGITTKRIKGKIHYLLETDHARKP